MWSRHSSIFCKNKIFRHKILTNPNKCVIIIEDKFEYRTFKCDRYSCETSEEIMTAKEGYKILKG